jgi:hypothetical protein
LVRFWASKNEHIIKLQILTISSSFVCPKEEARKGHPYCPGLSDCLALLVVDGTLKTRLRLKHVQRLVPSTTAMLSGTEWGPKKQKPRVFKSHFTQPSSKIKRGKSFGGALATFRSALSL